MILFILYCFWFFFYCQSGAPFGVKRFIGKCNNFFLGVGGHDCTIVIQNNKTDFVKKSFLKTTLISRN